MQRQYRCADYTVGWVCALPVELAAAQLMLDERHPELEHGATNDDNLYVLGRINGHNVAIGCLPAGRTGTVSAAVVATQMLAAFPKIRFGLMVGIGGGVPSAEADIRLGDVVVSQPDGTFGGVVQYDLGKTTMHGFLRTGSLNSPPDVLLNAITRIQANGFLGNSTLHYHASRLETERSTFQRSRTGRDILFDASYDHQDPHDRMCTMCDPSKVQIRESRLSGEEVIVHYGTIGSGNKVMKSALERDRVSAQLGGVLCFEMEAAGLMSTFPCLVIRGICDYSDSHKNDRWQPYAAGIAAAYAKEVLSVIKPIEVARIQIAMNDTDGARALQATQSSQQQQNDCDITTTNNIPGANISVMIHGTTSKSSSQADQSLYQSQSRSSSPLSMPTKHKLSEEQRKTIKNSLHFKQRDARLLTLKQAQTKTCQWLLKNPKYVDWTHADKLHQHRGFFWIKGKPGSGKSIMMKYLFSRAKRSMRGSIVLSFFFNARGAILEKTTSGLYRALILQLLDKAPQTWTAFEDDDDLDALLNLVEQSGWQDELLRQLFVRCLRKLENERVVCYVDALDECPEAAIRDMISLFEEIGEMESTAEFRVCFSSRHYPEISIRTGLQLVLEGEAEHTDDITLYIDANLKIGNDSQLEDVRAELLRKASGIFLWVHLVIPELNKEYDSGRIKALKTRLAQMPAGLHELFVDMLTRDQHRLEHFRLCVEIILYAFRPLNPNEFRIAVEAHSDSSFFDANHDPSSINSDNLRKYVLDSLKGLAEITISKDPTVQWIHESVRDFFLKENGLSKLNNPGNSSQDPTRHIVGHNIFVKLCFRQLDYAVNSSASYTAKYISKLKTHEWVKLFEQFPFLDYALVNIIQHANEAHRANRDQIFFHEQFKAYETFWRYSPPFRHISKKAHILYHLSASGADELIRSHPDKHSHLSLFGGVYDLPLLAALYHGRTEAARALLGLPSRSSSAQIEQASRSSFALKKDKYFSGNHILTHLCEYGDVDMLLHALADHDMTLFGVLPALYSYAASEAIVDVLARASKSIYESGNSFDNVGGAMKFLRDSNDSSEYANLRHLELFLKEFPDLRYDGYLWGLHNDMLSYAASKGFDRMARLCLDGAFAFQKRCAFLAAVNGNTNSQGRIAVLRQLFDAGLGVEPIDDDFTNAIFKMILTPNNEDLVRFVVAKADFMRTVCTNPNYYLRGKRPHGLTPLLWALWCGKKTYVKIFLDAGADPNARYPDNGRPTALMMSIKLVDIGSFRQLALHPECHLDAKDDHGRTALMWCALLAGGETVAVKMMKELSSWRLPSIRCGFNLVDKSGRNALVLAVESASEEAVETLLTWNIETRPYDGPGWLSTPLRLSIKLYVETKHEVFLKISRSLLCSGANLDCTKKVPTPAEIIARHDERKYTELRDLSDRIRG